MALIETSATGSFIAEALARDIERGGTPAVVGPLKKIAAPAAPAKKKKAPAKKRPVKAS